MSAYMMHYQRLEKICYLCADKPAIHGIVPLELRCEPCRKYLSRETEKPRPCKDCKSEQLLLNGLKNPNNRCYQNSVYRLMFTIPIFMSSFI